MEAGYQRTCQYCPCNQSDRLLPFSRSDHGLKNTLLASVITNIRVIVSNIVIYMKKILDFDWSRTVQLLCNSVEKFVILCNYNLKANKPIKMQKFL